MRILFWNVDCGTRPGVVERVRWFAERCDVICLQEVNHLQVRDSIRDSAQVRPSHGKTDQLHDLKLFAKLQEALRHTHIGYYTPNMRGMHDLEGSHKLFDYGMATFTRFAMRPETQKDETLHGPFGAADADAPASRKIVSFTLRSPRRKRYLIAQSHMLWDERGKIDTVERIRQSRRANEHLRHHAQTEGWGERLPVIFGGDFNLTSELQAFKMLTKARVYGSRGAVVLNHRFGITDTRTALYKKSEREADFVLVSPSLQCVLEVDYTVPSDHAALMVTVNET